MAQHKTSGVQLPITGICVGAPIIAGALGGSNAAALTFGAAIVIVSVGTIVYHAVK